MKTIFYQRYVAIFWACILALGIGAGKICAQEVDTDQINWGSLDGSVIIDSQGNTLALENFTFALGAFDADFTPTDANTQDWFANWRPFDIASYNESGGVFVGQYTMYTDPNGNFTGGDPGDFAAAGISRDAYYWIYNSTEPIIGTEWFLARASNWVFPTLSAECCNNEFPLEWSMSDLTASNTPIWGNQMGVEGSGVVSNFNGTSDLQTYTFIPEPSSVLLVAIAAIMGLMRRSRPGQWGAMPCGSASLAIIATASLSIAGVARSENIEWFCNVDAVNLDSGESPMGTDFIFELGVFTPGFTPTMSNLREWDAAWHPAQTATYRASESRFNGVFQVTHNTSPFLAGTNAWIMGTKVTPTGTEKILFRNPSWKWPSANRLNPLGKVWGVKQNASLQVVMGTVIPEGTPFLLQSEVLRDYEQWRQLKFANDPKGAPDQDPDGDGITNIMEFVFDTSPNSPGTKTSPRVALMKDGGRPYLQMTIPRNGKHLANLKVQVSSDLVDWKEGPAFTEVVEDSPTQLIMREKLSPTSPPAARKFMRLQAAP